MDTKALFYLKETFFNKPGSKRFYSPGKIHWGYDAFELALESLKGTNAVSFIDAAFWETPVFERLRSSLDSNSLFFRVDMPPSPERIAEIMGQVADIPETIVALGGGSTIDSAKCLVASMRYGSLDGVGMGGRRGEIPIHNLSPLFVALPSTAGTGAETSRYYVSYLEANSKKIHGKSWELVADWVFLDPEIGVTAPLRLKIESALDAFVHLSESFLCQEEASWVNSALSLAALEEMRSGLDLIDRDNNSRDGMLKLMSASCVGGIVISNVRTGHLHEMAGALLEHTGLNHPQTLAVFLKEGFGAIDKSDAGNRKLKKIANAFGEPDLTALVSFWERKFESCGSEAIISETLGKKTESEISNIKKSVKERTLLDVVWNEKECPVLINESIVDIIFDASFFRYLTNAG
jgi:alcohol dehydrogenase class IV